MYRNDTPKKRELPWIRLILTGIVMSIVGYIWLHKPYLEMSNTQHLLVIGIGCLLITILFGIINSGRISLTRALIYYPIILGSTILGKEIEFPLIDDLVAKCAIKYELLCYRMAIHNENKDDVFIDFDVNTQPLAHGDAGKLEETFKIFINRTVKLNNEYHDAITEAGCKRIWEKVDVRSSHSLSEQKAMIRKVRDCVQKFRAKNFKLFLVTRKSLEGLDITENLKQDTLKEYDKAWKKTKKRLTSLWDLENSLVKEYEKMINHLSFTKGDWVANGSSVFYKNKYDSDKHNGYLANIREIRSKQLDLKRETLQSLDNFLHN